MSDLLLLLLMYLFFWFGIHTYPGSEDFFYSMKEPWGSITKVIVAAIVMALAIGVFQLLDSL